MLIERKGRSVFSTSPMTARARIRLCFPSSDTSGSRIGTRPYRLRLLRINRKTLYVLMYRLCRWQHIAVDAKNSSPLGKNGTLLLVLLSRSEAERPLVMSSFGLALIGSVPISTFTPGMTERAAKAILEIIFYRPPWKEAIRKKNDAQRKRSMPSVPMKRSRYCRRVSAPAPMPYEARRAVAVCTLSSAARALCRT